MEDDGPQSGPQGDVRNSETDTARSAADEGPSAGARGASEEQDAVGERANHGRITDSGTDEQREVAVDSREPSGGRGPNGGANSDGGGKENWMLYLYDLLSSVGIVILIGVLLFAASGIWPPMVAVESGSMEPVMERGDLVFVMESDRFPGPGAHESGVVTAQAGQNTDYEKFDGHGDVIVYKPDGSDYRTPVIHRAMFWVEEGENWVEKANPEYLPEDAVCDGDAGRNGTDIASCPAPHAGFITKGDANAHYDQVNGIVRGPVKPAWVVGTAEHAVPYLGSIRLNAQASATDNRTVVISPTAG